MTLVFDELDALGAVSAKQDLQIGWSCNRISPACFFTTGEIHDSRTPRGHLNQRVVVAAEETCDGVRGVLRTASRSLGMRKSMMRAASRATPPHRAGINTRRFQARLAPASPTAPEYPQSGASRISVPSSWDERPGNAMRLRSLQEHDDDFGPRRPPSCPPTPPPTSSSSPASGKQCSHLIPLLLQPHLGFKRLRLAVNSATSEARLKTQYHRHHQNSNVEIEVIRADLTQPADCARLVAGVTTIYHVGPSVHPRETDIGYNMVDAAVAESKKSRVDSESESGLKHFVYSSVLNTQLRKMLNHDCKRYVKEYLMESGLPYTILQPTHFMDNFPFPSLLSQAQNQNPKQNQGQEQLVFTANFTPTIPFSFLSLRDLSEAAAAVVAQRERHLYAQYPLIRIETRPLEEAVRAFVKTLCGGAEMEEEVDQRTVDVAQRMLLYYKSRAGWESECVGVVDWEEADDA
ncbi:hypothetical protein VTN00DRAFT_9250 [Thermoascus crustaceus]|uniref:uncharacterized protein n=1 Tax=Thermoascus crustaceus TaxID=5088 RepID=UPI003743D749